MDIRVKLRAYREYYRASSEQLQQLRERRRRENETLRRWLGRDKPRTMAPIFLCIHSVITFGVFAATNYWLLTEYVYQGKAVPRGAILLIFVLPAIYLFAVHVLVRKFGRK
jgi:hypothetical protein